MKNTILKILYTVLVFFLILTVSIGLPIYLRPFYYAHINAMELPEISGHSYTEIKDYDENKQFAQMGVSGMEIFDIGREIEKTVLDNKTEIPIPFSVY
ncbi:MAG: hypothetical protein IKB23_03460, partial [Clostridia bacterium]|nr:hypothetical protein [Clostridia bacterium]